MQDYTINVNLLTSLLNYLVTKPFAEVHELVAAIQKLSPIEQASAAPEHLDK
jgi:hypothetical protein